MTLPVVLLSGVLAFSLIASLEMLAFWADNVWSLLGPQPHGLQPAGRRAGAPGLLPRKGAGGPRLPALDPARVLPDPLPDGPGGDRRNGCKGMGLTVLWILVFAALGSWLWRRGLRNYAGVGI